MLIFFIKKNIVREKILFNFRLKIAEIIGSLFYGGFRKRFLFSSRFRRSVISRGNCPVVHQNSLKSRPGKNEEIIIKYHRWLCNRGCRICGGGDESLYRHGNLIIPLIKRGMMSEYIMPM